MGGGVGDHADTRQPGDRGRAGVAVAVRLVPAAATVHLQSTLQHARRSPWSIAGTVQRERRTEGVVGLGQIRIRQHRRQFLPTAAESEVAMPAAGAEAYIFSAVRDLTLARVRFDPGAAPRRSTSVKVVVAARWYAPKSTRSCAAKTCSRTKPQRARRNAAHRGRMRRDGQCDSVQVHLSKVEPRLAGGFGERDLPLQLPREVKLQD